jgi:hypothetical protein
MALSQDGRTRTVLKKAGIPGVGGGEEGVREPEKNVMRL